MSFLGKKASAQWAFLSVARFILAVGVMVTHLYSFFPKGTLAQSLGWAGHASVFGFFMISGYSIAASIQSRPQGYLMRRLKRIFPAYLMALLFSFLLTLGGAFEIGNGQAFAPPSMSVLLGNLFMLQGPFYPTFDTNRALWSLSIEWWCYFTAPLLVLARPRYVLAFVVCLVGSIFVRAAIFGGSHVFASFWTLPTFWLSAWVGGFYFYRTRSFSAYLLMLVPPLVWFAVFLRIGSGPFVLLALSSFLLVFAQRIAMPSKTVQRGMNWLGDVSYPVFLFHYPLLCAMAAHTRIHSGDTAFLYALLIICCGYASVRKLMTLWACRWPAFSSGSD